MDCDMASLPQKFNSLRRAGAVFDQYAGMSLVLSHVRVRSRLYSRYKVAPPILNTGISTALFINLPSFRSCVLNNHCLQALALLLLDIYSLDVAVQLLLRALLVITFP